MGVDTPEIVCKEIFLAGTGVHILLLYEALLFAQVCQKVANSIEFSKNNIERGFIQYVNKRRALQRDFKRSFRSSVYRQDKAPTACIEERLAALKCSSHGDDPMDT